nr:nucleotide-binding protein [Lysinibacillus endophyticus]
MEVTNIPGKKGNQELFEFDKFEKDEIIEEIIIPYLKKEDIQFNGYFLKHNYVVRIVVKTTTEYPNIIADKINSGKQWSFLDREDIVKGAEHSVDITKEIFAEARQVLEMRGEFDSNIQPSNEEIDKKKVFIVHGHDEAVKASVARFLEKLDLTPIILHEQANQGRTIIEKIEDYTNVGFGIVLYTPCDIGKANSDSEYKPRARQNVVFEHGYLISKLGRNNVCALVKDDVEKPGDISGVVYIQWDSGNGWHFELIRELKSSGYEVDANVLFNS